MHHKSANKERGPTKLKRSCRSNLALQDVKILVVEDESILAMDLQDLLESHGAIVLGPATTVEEAMELAGNGHFDGAILDVHVTGKDIFPVAKLLTQRGIPFLFHTGHGDAQVLRRDWPDSEVLMKPVQYDRLLSLVARMAERAPITRH